MVIAYIISLGVISKQLSERLAHIVGGRAVGLLNSLSQDAAKEVGGTRAALWGDLGNIYSQARCGSTLNKDGICYIKSLQVHLQAIQYSQ